MKWQLIGVLVVSSYLPDNNSKIKYLLWKWQKVVLLNCRHWTIILVNSRLLRSSLLRSLHRDLTCSKDTNFVCTSWKIRKTDFDRIQKTKTWIPLPYFCKMFCTWIFFSFLGNYPRNSSILGHISNRPNDVRCRLSRFHWGERNWASSFLLIT